MKYNVGDKVRIKSIDWYNENKDKVGNIRYKRDGSAYPVFFSKYMSNFCGEILTIKSVFNHSYHMNETSSCEFWTDKMIEGLAEESDDFEKMYMESEKRYEEEYSKGEYCHEQSFKWGFQEGYDYAHENEKLEINLKNGYEFRDDSGNVINTQKIIMGKKKKEYPKTYVECCELLSLGEDGRLYTKGYKASLIQDFQKLLICRDAYWKIAGEEMGLGKPWKPDWNNISDKYCIYFVSGYAWPKECQTRQCTFAFPTAEMRDAFKENFDPDIEICKELL